MKTLSKGSMKPRGALWLMAVLLALICRPVSAQTTVISNYSQFLSNVLNSSIPVITNFLTNTTISLATGGQTFPIKHSVTIDGGTNGVVFDGNLAAHIFTVSSNCQLILNNLQILNGVSTNGGAIYSEGSLIISNCTLAGNSATNITGVQGTTNNDGGNGGSGGGGGTAEGGAIYSRGPVSIYNSVVGTNSSIGGNGGNGGQGGNSLLFGGLGGNGGAGGGASGAAVYSLGSNNIFVSTEFIANTCTAGTAGSGAAPGSGAFAGFGGAGAPGGSAYGGAVYVTGPVFVTNCIFAQNTATAGASGEDQAGNNGDAGGFAAGGGLYIPGTVTNAWIENTVFFNNTCTGGAGGSSTQGTTGGNGGSAEGGGLWSQAALTTIRNCTLATNTLVAGTYGTGTSRNGSTGSKIGWEIYRRAGVVNLSGSILSGGTNVSPNPSPNASGVTDAGYNISSDSSLAQVYTNTLTNANVLLDSGLAFYGGPPIGPASLQSPPVFLTLAILPGSPAAGLVQGVPGLGFPATDALGNDRGAQASAGAYEIAPISLDTNRTSLSVDFTDSTSTNVMTDKGSMVTFTVNASSTDTNNPLGYQWQLNGTNLPDNYNFIGANTNSLTIYKVTDADQGDYQVIVSDSLLENAATSSVASITITNPVKITAQPAGKSNVPVGSVVTFSVGVTGSPPLSFQWYMGTTMLTDTNEISGSTASNLTINPATAIDDGSYFVVVANNYNAVTSVVAVLSVNPVDDTKPTVKISSPASGARTNSSVVTGTATDNAQVIYVNYWVTNINAWSPQPITTYSNTASLGTNGTTTKTWSITNALLPGTNHVTVQSVDYSGNKSGLVTSEFFYESPALFQLVTNGPGGITGSASFSGDVRPTNGAMLNIGEGYTLTAKPAANYVLSNWVSSTGQTTNSPTFHFIMETNLVIAANITTNLFIGAGGTYNGLFYQTNAVTEQTAGMLANLALHSTGSYSGNLLLDGAAYGLSGSFNTSGYATNQLKAKTGPVSLEMALDWTNGMITGNVSGSNPVAWVSPLEAEKSVAALPSAEYTVLLAPGTNSTSEIPPGFGYLLITNHLGSVALNGALADGNTFSQGVPVGVFGDLPVFYGNLYKSTGLLLGWLGLSNGAIEVETPMVWIKPSALSGIYTNGFTNNLRATASGWTNPPPRQSALSLADGALMISNAGLALEFAISITNDTVVKASNAPTNALAGTIAPKTGLLTITFGNGAGKSSTIGYGAMLQDSTNGAGYFVTRTNAGSILLTNTPP
jgi:hypothetical protein